VWQGFNNVQKDSLFILATQKKGGLIVFNDRLIIFIIFFHVLGLIKTLFSIIIQGLFGSEFGLACKSFGLVFVCE
jgi:hypothetical protein